MIFELNLEVDLCIVFEIKRKRNCLNCRLRRERSWAGPMERLRSEGQLTGGCPAVSGCNIPNWYVLTWAAGLDQHRTVVVLREANTVTPAKQTLAAMG